MRDAGGRGPNSFDPASNCLNDELRNLHQAADRADTGPLSSFTLQANAGQWDDAKDSEVSPCGFRKDQRVQRQGRHGTLKALRALPEPFQVLALFCVYSAAPLLSAVMSLPSHFDLSDRVNRGYALPQKNFNPPQLHDNLFRLEFLDGYLRSFAFPILGADNFNGGASSDRRR